MIKLILFFLLLPFGAAAQRQAFPTTPAQYNDMLFSYTDSLYLLGKEWGSTFNEAYKTGNYSLLKPKAANIRRYSKKSIAVLSAIPDVKESKPLRIAIIDMIKFEMQMADSGFKAFELFNVHTPKAMVAAAISNLKKLSSEEGNYLKAISAEQEKYAADNGFKIAAE